jgi:N-acetylmuramoyl-L-alanine amidase
MAAATRAPSPPGAPSPRSCSAWRCELKRLLEARGVHVIMTRDDDTFLSLPQRSTFATTDRNLFVSLHANAADNRSANGIETWVFGQPLDPA